SRSPVCGKRAGLTKANGGAAADARPGSGSASRDEDRGSTGALAVDGKFGPATTRALQGWVGTSQDGSLSSGDIKALQSKIGAVPDGKIGSETTHKLRAAMGLGGNGVSDFRTNYSTVKALQTLLNKWAPANTPAPSPPISGARVVDANSARGSSRVLQGWVGVSQDGSLSRSDIRALQGKVGAVQDGKIGSETTRKLRAAMGLGGNGVWDFRSNYSTVKALQQYLNAR